MSDLTDSELLGYCTLHCRTEVAAFHKKHIIRLLRMADMNDEADNVEKSPREWYYLGEDVIDPIVAKICAKEK